MNHRAQAAKDPVSVPIVLLAVLFAFVYILEGEYIIAIGMLAGTLLFFGIIHGIVTAHRHYHREEIE